ncbi:MAG: hypothetical protein ABIH35_03000 [Patescibacteria group bacterium]
MKIHPFLSPRNLVAIAIMLVLTPFIFVADLLAEIYHRTCFPLYGIKCISRRKYIQIDRHKLKYLNVFEKIGCVYCGYVNGLVNYWVAGAAASEAYWCGIRHKRTKGFIPPAHHKKFLKYGDKKGWQKFLRKK